MGKQIMKTIARIALCLAATSVLSLPFAGSASARNMSYSAGKGVKCYYVLVSSNGSQQAYQTVCRKSGV